MPKLIAIGLIISVKIRLIHKYSSIRQDYECIVVDVSVSILLLHAEIFKKDIFELCKAILMPKLIAVVVLGSFEFTLPNSVISIFVCYVLVAIMQCYSIASSDPVIEYIAVALSILLIDYDYHWQTILYLENDPKLQNVNTYDIIIMI